MKNWGIEGNEFCCSMNKKINTFSVYIYIFFMLNMMVKSYFDHHTYFVSYTSQIMHLCKLIKLSFRLHFPFFFTDTYYQILRIIIIAYFFYRTCKYSRISYKSTVRIPSRKISGNSGNLDIKIVTTDLTVFADFLTIRAFRIYAVLSPMILGRKLFVLATLRVAKLYDTCAKFPPPSPSTDREPRRIYPWSSTSVGILCPDSFSDTFQRWTSCHCLQVFVSERPSRYVIYSATYSTVPTRPGGRRMRTDEKCFFCRFDFDRLVAGNHSVVVGPPSGLPVWFSSRQI